MHNILFHGMNVVKICYGVTNQLDTALFIIKKRINLEINFRVGEEKVEKKVVSVLM